MSTTGQPTPPPPPGPGRMSLAELDRLTADLTRRTAAWVRKVRALDDWRPKPPPPPPPGPPYPPRPRVARTGP